MLYFARDDIYPYTVEKQRQLSCKINFNVVVLNVKNFYVLQHIYNVYYVIF